MELKVWVEGIQRIVCGVSETTTCQDVVFALAHATGKSGRFTLIERWRNNEKQLAPQDNPLKVLLKWGEYLNDVQFILQRTESTKTGPLNNTKSLPANHFLGALSQTAHTQKTSQLFSTENVGVVKGIPQQVKTLHLEVKDETKTVQQEASPKMTPNVRENPSYQLYSNSPQSSPKKGSSSAGTESPKPRPAPPPYRDPPPPPSNVNFKRSLCQEGNQQKKNWLENRSINPAEVASYGHQYRELVALINYQKEKLHSQQADLNKFDTEIVFFENKEREKQLQLDFIAQELIQVSNQSKAAQEQIQALSYVEEESELVKQQEKTLKSEITLLRSKLANCETELLQCKNKIRLLMDELQAESRMQSKTSESRKQIERTILIEVERLQKDIEFAKQNSDLHYMTADTLKTEVIALEVAINEKKMQVEALVTEMKEANLLSLSISPPDDIRLILDGPKQRKMVGSPRQLETAVPTSKNPHGVWV